MFFKISICGRQDKIWLKHLKAKNVWQCKHKLEYHPQVIDTDSWSALTWDFLRYLRIICNTTSCLHPLTQILNINCLQFLLGKLKYSVEIKTKGHEKLCGEGPNKVYYRRCGNGEKPISWHYEVCIIVFNFSWDNLNNSRKKKNKKQKKNKGFTKLSWRVEGGGGVGSRQGVLWKMRKWGTTNKFTC